MQPKEIEALVKAGEALLIDVREECELLETGMACGAVWIPLSAMEECGERWKCFVGSLPRDKKLFLYCRGGRRAGRVAARLCCEGFCAESLGGIDDWMAAGLALVPKS